MLPGGREASNPHGLERVAWAGYVQHNPDHAKRILGAEQCHSRGHGFFSSEFSSSMSETQYLTR